jgi:hypothetical protein
VKTSLTSPPLLVGDSAAPANFQDHFQQFFSLGQLKADGGKIHCDITMLGNLARQDPQYSSTSQHFVWKLGWRPISCLFAKVSSCRQATVKLAVRLVKFRTICSKMAWNFEMAVIRCQCSGVTLLLLMDLQDWFCQPQCCTHASWSSCRPGNHAINSATGRNDILVHNPNLGVSK